MKTHEFNIAILPQSPLFGIQMKQYEKKNTRDLYNPVISIELGFVFFTLSYRNTDYSIENE